MSNRIFSGRGWLHVLAPLAALGLAQGAPAGSVWSSLGVAVAPGNAPAVVAATDDLMKSEIGKEFPGRLLLQIQLADGSDPSTHSFVPVYRSAADREAYFEKLQADPAFSAFQKKLAELADGTTTASYRVQRSWGDVSDDDDVWMTYAFSVSNPIGFVAANESFIGSATGKKFPGQLHLSSASAAGFGTSMTHLLSVGFASEAEMESWMETVAASPEWQSYLAALNANSEYLGANMARTAAAWGSVSLKKLVAP